MSLQRPAERTWPCNYKSNYSRTWGEVRVASSNDSGTAIELELLDQKNHLQREQ